MGTSSISPSKKTAVFDFHFDELDELAEKNARWRPTGSGKKKTRSGDSPVDNYTFLQSFAGGNEPKGKKKKGETITIDEVDEAVKERIFRSDTALQSSSSNFNLKSSAGSKCSDFITPKPPHKAATQRFCLDDNEPVSLISDEDSDGFSTISDDDINEDLSGEQSLVQESTSHEMETGVVVRPTYVEVGENCYWKSHLTFFSSSIKIDVSERKEPTDSLTYEWKIADLISIESKWSDPSVTADITLHIKLDHSKQPISAEKSGILKVNFSICDSNWDFTQELIKSLDEQYKDKWDVDLDSYESFEDITYRGVYNSISITKRDFELLAPERFINDTIVDFYIEYLKKMNPAEERVHFFNSFFFRKLADFDENQLQMFDAKAAFQRVRKWTKRVDIFQKDYIIIPVNFRLHWSLIVICHPGEVVNFEDEEMESSLKVPCILHMDSIKGSHRGVENCIKCYLWEEWKERSRDTTEGTCRMFKNLRFLRLEVPQQENSYDCGLFMLHFMELFVKQAPSSFSPLTNFISKDWFYPREASLKRVRIKRLLVELGKTRSEQVLSPNHNDKSSSENEEESEGVEILDENSSETCVNIPRDAAPIMVKPLRSKPYESDSDDFSESDTERDNDHGKMVLYNDPLLSPVLSPIKESEEEEGVEKQVAVMEASKKMKMEEDPNLMHLHKSLNLLRLKGNHPCGGLPSTSTSPSQDDDVPPVPVADVEEKHEKSPCCSSSSDDQVLETLFVKDSDSDDSDHPPPTSYRRKFNSFQGKEAASSCIIRKYNDNNNKDNKRRHHGVSQAKKRLRSSSSSPDLQVVITLGE